MSFVSKNFIFFLAVVLFFNFSGGPVFGQAVQSPRQNEPQFMVSWQAKSFVPFWYAGKILPTKGSQVSVSFELIDAGSLADLSKSRVRWYVNDKLVRNEDNGLGIKSFQFTLPDYANFVTEVKITVLDYKSFSQLNKVVAIPSAAPKIAINAPFADLTAGKNPFEAAPFFFNIKKLSDLSYTWSANNQTAENGGNATPWLIDLEIDPLMPKNSEMAFSVLAQNKSNSFEFAEKKLLFRIK